MQLQNGVDPMFILEVFMFSSFCVLYDAFSAYIHYFMLITKMKSYLRLEKS